MEFTINQGLLACARQAPSPNYDQRPDEDDISLIVIHNISLPPNTFGGPWIDALFTNQLPSNHHPFFETIQHLRVSSHLLIRRDGEIVQYVPFHQRAFHAGISAYQQRTACNDFSIGIELEGTDFTPFTEAQYEQLTQTIICLTQFYPNLSLKHITGHEHIAPGRKTDPGPHFDWSRLSKTFNTHLPSDPTIRE